MSYDAIAVVVGVFVGLLASVPMSLLFLAILQRPRRRPLTIDQQGNEVRTDDLPG